MSLELNKYVRFMFFLYVIRPKKAWVKPLPINLEKHEVARCTSLMCSLDTPKWETWKMGFLSSRDTNIPSWASLVESLTSAEDKGIVSDLIGIAI